MKNESKLQKALDELEHLKQKRDDLLVSVRMTEQQIADTANLVIDEIGKIRKVVATFRSETPTKAKKKAKKKVSKRPRVRVKDTSPKKAGPKKAGIGTGVRVYNRASIEERLLEVMAEGEKYSAPELKKLVNGHFKEGTFNRTIREMVAAGQLEKTGIKAGSRYARPRTTEATTAKEFLMDDRSTEEPAVKEEDQAAPGVKRRRPVYQEGTLPPPRANGAQRRPRVYKL